MEFLQRHQTIQRPGGVEILVNKRVAHEDFIAWLSEPWRLWETPRMITDHQGKNRLGHGAVKVGLSECEIWLKEFLPKSTLDTALSFGRRSRAARAFEAGLAMRERDILTPEPLAAVTVRRMGWIRRCWLLTENIGQFPSVREIGDHPERFQSLLAACPWPRLLEMLGQTLRTLGDAHICHRDLSLRNILVDWGGEAAPERTRLWVIDLNRVLVCDASSWTQALATRNVERLRLSPEDFDHTLRAMFPGSGEFEKFASAYTAARERHRRYKRIKKLPRRKS